MKTVRAILIALISTIPASATYAAMITIFSDFGPGNSYESFQGAPIGLHTFAMPFSSSTPAVVKQIDLGLTWIKGTNAVNVGLYTNSGGSLGTLLGSWSVGNFPTFGTTANSVTTISGITGVVLKPGDSYYLSPTPADSTTVVTWNINSIGTLGDRLIDSGIQPGVELSAFDIIGEGPAVPTVPEPSTWAMMLIGFGGLGYAAYRRQKKNAAALAVG